MNFSKLTDPEDQACCSTDLYSAGLGKINEQRNISTKSVRILSSTGGKLGRNLVSCLSTWKSFGFFYYQSPLTMDKEANRLKIYLTKLGCLGCAVKKSRRDRRLWLFPSILSH